MTEISYQLQDLEMVARQVIQMAGDSKIWVFQGEMGAGKTTLIKEICRLMGVVDQVSSPTFGIVNQYEDATREVVYHFDFYRMEDEMEALEIGIEEYFYSSKICLLEWAENIISFLPDQFYLIRIKALSGDTRTLTVQHVQNAS